MMLRRGWLALALALAGCGGGMSAMHRADVTFALSAVDGSGAGSLPVDTAGGRPVQVPGPGPSPYFDGVPEGTPLDTAPPLPLPSIDVSLSLGAGETYALARVAGGAAGGLALGVDALSATFSAIAGIVVLPDGTLYACDPLNHQVRMIPPVGPTAVVAGASDGAEGNFGDNVAATHTRLSKPMGLARDPATGALFVADSGNGRVRIFTPGGRIYTYAGGGTVNVNAIQQSTTATSIRLFQPYGLALGGPGNMYVSDRSNGKVYQVDVAGRITLIATLAANQAGAIAASTAGDRLWVAEGGKVRMIHPGESPPLSPDPVFEAPTGTVTGLATDQAGSLFVLVTASSPFGQADTRVWRVATDVAGRAPVLIAGRAGSGESEAAYTASPEGVADGAEQVLAGGGHCGLAIDLYHAVDPDQASGILYQANTYDDGAGVRWGQINRLRLTP